MSEPIVYLNGDFLPLADAKISVLDRGFIFGDGVYEVIPVYQKKPFRLSQHLQRLQNSLDGIRLHNPLSAAEWESVLQQVIDKNDHADQSIYLQVTRGIAKRDHFFPTTTQPTVFVMSNPLAAADPQAFRRGVAAITHDDIRWQYCNIKAITLLANVLLRQQAADHQAYEAILIRDGLITEGAASNIFIVKDGVITTPPKNNQLLPGVTRDLVVELAQQHQIACRETFFNVHTLRAADEIFLTSSTREILPVVKLDGATVSQAQAGALTTRLYQIYQEYKARLKSGLVN